MSGVREFFYGGSSRAARIGSALGSLTAIGVGLLMLYVAVRALIDAGSL